MVIKYPEDNKYNVTSTPSATPTAAPAEAPSAAPKGSIFTDNSAAVPSTPSSSGGSDTSQSTSAAPVQGQDVPKHEPKVPPKMAKDMTPAEKYIARYPSGVDIDELIADLQDKLEKHLITDEEKVVLEELLRTNSEDTSGATPPPASDASKKTEYEKLYNKDGSVYEKLSAVLDKYFTENDSNYKTLSAEDKKAFIDSKIAEFKKLSGTSEEATPQQLDALMKNMAQVYIDAAVTNRPVSELKTKKDVDNRLNEIENKDAEVKTGTTKSPEYEAKKAEYEEVYSKSGTEYEKTSAVIDKYLTENDPEYARLTNEKQKRAYRDAIIGSMREKLGYSSNITQAQRNIMQKEIAKLFIDAAASGVPLSKDTPSSEVKTRLNAIDNNSASTSTSSIKDFKLDETKSTHDQLHDIVDYVLTQTDPNYRKLTDPKQKQAYIEAAKGKLSEQLFKIDIGKSGRFR